VPQAGALAAPAPWRDESRRISGGAQIAGRGLASARVGLDFEAELLSSIISPQAAGEIPGVPMRERIGWRHHRLRLGRRWLRDGRAPARRRGAHYRSAHLAPVAHVEDRTGPKSRTRVRLFSGSLRATLGPRLRATVRRHRRDFLIAAVTSTGACAPPIGADRGLSQQKERIHCKSSSATTMSTRRLES
jgi:hypothetical protein